MKLHSILTEGVLPQFFFDIGRLARFSDDAQLRHVREYIDEQVRLLQAYGEDPTKRTISGHVKIGFHNHFPKKEGWYDWDRKMFNPDRISEFAQAAHSQGFDVVSVTNYDDDTLFGNGPGIKFDFKGESVIVLRSQECLEFFDVQPIGFSGRLDKRNLETVIDSALGHGGIVLFSHPANMAYGGAGEDNIARYNTKVIIETQNALANSPWFFRFADIVSKLWSIKYSVPGVSGIDSHQLYMPGGFFVPRDLIDMNSPQSVMQCLVRLFARRREELLTRSSLSSQIILNTEDYPDFLTVMKLESIPQISTSIRYGSRKYFGLRI